MYFPDVCSLKFHHLTLQNTDVSLASDVAVCSLTDLSDRSQEVSSFQDTVDATKLSAKEARLLRLVI